MAEQFPQKTIENLYKEVKSVIEDSRNSAYRAVNFAMVQAYWSMGKLIVEEEQKGEERAEYGSELVEQLSQRLTDYGNNFNKRNLWYMKQFYQTFPKVNALRSELSWTHYRLLLKVEKEEAREFYLKEAIDCNWSTRSLERQLERQIGNLYYERMFMSRNDKVVKEEALQKTQEQEASDIIKDPYVLEFLGLKDNPNFRESELEQAIIDKLQDFLLELGKGFAFVGRQHRLTTETGKHFYADLVFYNYILKCFLIIDLKTTELSHQDIGQMDMYVRYFEDKVRTKSDNPTIGLILCTEKDHTVVKYSLLNESKQVFASKYMTYLPTEEELKKEIEKERKEIEMEKKLN